MSIMQEHQSVTCIDMYVLTVVIKRLILTKLRLLFFEH